MPDERSQGARPPRAALGQHGSAPARPCRPRSTQINVEPCLGTCRQINIQNGEFDSGRYLVTGVALRLAKPLCSPSRFCPILGLQIPSRGVTAGSATCLKRSQEFGFENFPAVLDFYRPRFESVSPHSDRGRLPAWRPAATRWQRVAALAVGSRRVLRQHSARRGVEELLILLFDRLSTDCISCTVIVTRTADAGEQKMRWDQRFAVTRCWSRGDSNRRSHPTKSSVCRRIGTDLFATANIVV